MIQPADAVERQPYVLKREREGGRSKRPATPDGLTVAEVATFVAAPLGSLTLAQLGAEVIQDRPAVGGGADPGTVAARAVRAPACTSTGLNKGKRSVTVNFREAEGSTACSGDLLAATGPACGGIVLTNATGRAGLAGLLRAGPGSGRT